MNLPQTQARLLTRRFPTATKMLPESTKKVASELNHTYVPNVRLKMKRALKASRLAGPSPVETRGRVLDAAERLFAGRGIEAVSIRDITRAAGVNLAAINYHFGTKQKLVAEIFSRRLTPLNQQRLTLLDAVEQKAKGKPARLEMILEALIRPAVEQGFACTCGSKTFMQLFGRCLSEPNAAVEKLIHSHFERIIRRFNAAILRALPRLSEQELFWRASFIGGAMHHALLICGKPSLMPTGMHKRLNAEELICRLIAFSAAGLRVSARH